MNLMYGDKPAENNYPRVIEKEWQWVAPEYKVVINHPVSEIKEIEIDPSQRMADVNRVNNKITVPE